MWQTLELGVVEWSVHQARLWFVVDLVRRDGIVDPGSIVEALLAAVYVASVGKRVGFLSVIHSRSSFKA